MTDPYREFSTWRSERIDEMLTDAELEAMSLAWMLKSDRYKYSYIFEWLGRPVIRYPTDLLVLQEVIWEVKPSLIIETGIAHGGSLVFSASVLQLLGAGHVVGVDIDLRPHNRAALLAHRLANRMTLLDGSSTDPEVLAQVSKFAAESDNTLVVLDSLHTHEHALTELREYSKFVSPNSYIVVADTFIERFPRGYFNDRPWDVGNNPMTAVRSFLSENHNFEIDRSRNKAMISEASDGYLRRVR